MPPPPWPVPRAAGRPHDGDKQTVAAFRQAFPDLDMTVEDILVEGDRATVRFRATGTQHGPFGAFSASGRPVDFTGTGTARVRDGQIVERWVNGDLLGLLQQLGATITPPGQ
jgi:predicted ester cyclase